MVSLASFFEDWLKNRFGVGKLVRQHMLHFYEALTAHRDRSLLVALVFDFCDAKLSVAQLFTFM